MYTVIINNCSINVLPYRRQNKDVSDHTTEEIPINS
jgi:hypothetical protein